MAAELHAMVEAFRSRPAGGRVVQPETVAGQPRQAERWSADRAGEDPAQTRRKPMQYRPGLIDGFLAKTGLDLTLP
jgi:hypothetical protein